MYIIQALGLQHSQWMGSCSSNSKEKRGDGEAQSRQDDTTMQSKSQTKDGEDAAGDAAGDADADENEPRTRQEEAREEVGRGEQASEGRGRKLEFAFLIACPIVCFLLTEWKGKPCKPRRFIGGS